MKKQTGRQLLAAVLCAFFTILLPGCNTIGLDVENHLRPPKFSGEQEAIQQALEQDILSRVEKGGVDEYILKYPKQGSYRSAFILVDQVKPNAMSNLNNFVHIQPATKVTGTGDAGVDEATEALAFYCMDEEGAKTHINLLRKEGDTWKSVADVEGASEDIHQVDFGDLNGDGKQELLVSWSVYNSRDKRLIGYSLADNLSGMGIDETCTHSVVNDLQGTGRDQVMLFNISSSENLVTVQLCSYENEALALQGETRLDGYIQRFGNSRVAALTETVNALYIDCYKDPSTTLTELVYWDKEGLHAPLYRPEDNITTLSARESSIPSMDIDGDGVMEWPVSVRLPGYDTADVADAMWRTTWMSWDYVTGQTQSKFSCIMNTRDGYYLRLDDAWADQVTAVYDEEIRQLSLQSLDTGEGDKVTYLQVIATALNDSKSLPLKDGFEKLMVGSNVQYSMKYDDAPPLQLNQERIRLMFTLLPTEK